MKVKCAIVVLIAIMVPQTAWAVTVYDETVDGDISGASVPVALGTNDILGTLSQSPGGDSGDVFTITVPNGLDVLDITLMAALVNGEQLNVELSDPGLNLFDDAFNLPAGWTGGSLSASFVDTAAPTVGSLTTTGPTSFHMSLLHGTLFNTTEWKVTVTTQNTSGGGPGAIVPEPTTATLGLLGVVGLMVRRRRAA